MKCGKSLEESQFDDGENNEKIDQMAEEIMSLE
jgi:hypothetical protein